jgi:3-hydroxyacyl-CoA dehydrogenase/enoyl-CoA hydratase/3-hydroxybutyryl-CoA epimerase
VRRNEHAVLTVCGGGHRLFGGVLQYADQYDGGVAGFVRRAEELADVYGDRFRPPALLHERAVAAGTLHAALTG